MFCLTTLLSSSIGEASARAKNPSTSTVPLRVAMDEQFILRVTPSIAERIERLLNETASSASSSAAEDKPLDISFSEDGRTGTFSIGNDTFPASLLDLPTVVESFKTYDDSVLIKTADVGQMIMVSDAVPEAVELRHGLTPPMRDARKRRFRREPDLNPELVRRVEEDLLNISAGRAAETFNVEANKTHVPAPVVKPDVPETGTNAEEADRSDSDESEDSG